MNAKLTDTISRMMLLKPEWTVSKMFLLNCGKQNKLGLEIHTFETVENDFFFISFTLELFDVLPFKKSTTTNKLFFSDS